MPDDNMYFVLSGDVGIFKKRGGVDHEMERLSTGSFFGEMALINERPRLATARVLSREARLARMNREMLLKLAGVSPEFVFMLLKHAITRLLAAEDKLQRVREELSTKTGKRKIY